MKNKMKWILSFVLLCCTVAQAAAMDLNDKAGMEEIKKKKKKAGKKLSEKGKKKKKGFWSKMFGAK